MAAPRTKFTDCKYSPVSCELHSRILFATGEENSAAVTIERREYLILNYFSEYIIGESVCQGANKKMDFEEVVVQLYHETYFLILRG